MRIHPKILLTSLPLMIDLCEEREEKTRMKTKTQASKPRASSKTEPTAAKKTRRHPESSAQLTLTGLKFTRRLAFGGSLLKSSHAKEARPLSSKKALHIVLRSDWATGPRSFLKFERIIQNTLLKLGRRHGVRVYRVANAGNHLHLLVRFTQRRGLQNFLRASTGLIARKVLGAERGRAMKWDSYLAPGRSLESSSPAANAARGSNAKRNSGSTPHHAPHSSPRPKPLIPAGQSFWSQRPFTRIVSWGKDFDSTLSYLKLNTLESFGFLKRRFVEALPTHQIRARLITELSTALGYG
jgi:hypothetical protein